MPIKEFNFWRNKWLYAIVIGAQYGKVSKGSSGDETALYLEKIAYDVMGYLEKKNMRYLVIHPEDEYDPGNRMGLLSFLGDNGRMVCILKCPYLIKIGRLQTVY